MEASYVEAHKNTMAVWYCAQFGRRCAVRLSANNCTADNQTAPAALGIVDNTVKLPLESVLLLALKNNLDITFARMQPEVAATDIQREEGKFDTLFTSEFSKYRENKQVANVLNTGVGTSPLTEHISGAL